jgi:predicted lipoprotein with Yx(FWY)xxD motif
MERVWAGIAAIVCIPLIAAAHRVDNAPRGNQAPELDEYVLDNVPSGFQVVPTDYDGPVFADARGHTLYRWPEKDLRNGTVGERRGKPLCDNTVYKVNSGLMSPYPPGLVLPEVETRPSCVQLWPPAMAAPDAKPIGEFSIVSRPDGSRQWAYGGYALYTSVRDTRPGDVTERRPSVAADVPGMREPVGPPTKIPPQFVIHRHNTGLMLATHDNKSVYTFDKDGVDKSNCFGSCLEEWTPVLAPEFLRPQGRWTIFERAPGIRQWAYRSKPLYTYNDDGKPFGMEGSDIPGWHNAYIKVAPPPPAGFSIQDSRAGQVLADPNGKTVYIYHCTDDALDQLPCDNPDTPQAYRFAICGGGDPERCLKTWPPILARKDAKIPSHSWTVAAIDPKTGHYARPNDPDALYIWQFKGKPVYTYIKDREPGDIEGDALGEFNGWRNGFKAFWIRDDYRNNADN